MSKRTRAIVVASAFLLPNLLGFLFFTLGPALTSLALAVTEWDLLTPPRFVGFANFGKLLGFSTEAGHWTPNDPFFWKYLGNTLFLMAGIPFSMFGSLLLAILLNQKLRGIVAFRAIYFLPSICPAVAICMLWRWLYQADVGLFNAGIQQVGQWFGQSWRGPGWLVDQHWAKPALMQMGFWSALGGSNMILYLAALQGIPRSCYEAAEIDGASACQRFFNITLPLVAPTTFFIGTMSIIAGFQGGFMAAFIMTRGGPNGATTTLEYYIYQNGFQWLRMGYASAVAWVLFALVLGFTILGWRYAAKRVTYA
ncbi:MAG: sugar ABC transporter permease [Verrucomicrobia bacterium]|jgi:multiple sugar transport system permease protein|nr:sugar ABC transporter permease [Verrucomicrobiota bacterium]MBT7067253.1 sugar ABC transporter permease [Verrucomicrobiota bacterium]MBT7701607.1 sugar ABC transporter permease [Verrucomicrobiota bacterium]